MEGRSFTNLGFEEKLFKAADKLRKNMDAAEYKHIVLGLIFLKFVSDAFQHRRNNLVRELRAPYSGFADNPDAIERTLEDRDEYAGENIFWVPLASRWGTLQANATQPTIGKLIDDALYQLEQENPSLKGVFTKNYSRSALESRTLTELINLFRDIDFMEGRQDTNESEQDVVGRVYEYCLKSFATAEGKRGGQFYTPPVVVRVLVEMLEPYEGRVFDPCCGSGGMFVQSRNFIREHTRQQPGLFNKRGISVYGQESNETTWRLCKMNLAVHGIDGDIAWNPEGSFMRDTHPDLRADFVIANPPFNDSDWGGQLLRDDPRWKYGTPPVGNANYAWIQHFLYHLNDHGFAGFVMANGSLSSQQSGEGDIRRRLIEEDLVDCIVSMPGQLFYSTGIPVSLWFLAKNKAAKGMRSRKGETLFINSGKLGFLEDRTHRMLTDEEVARIADTYHIWRGTKEGDYEDVPGFCKAATTEEIAKSDYVLTPGRYCGSEAVEDDGEPFAEKFARLRAQLADQFEESARLQGEIERNLGSLIGQ
jgi:type I restriction enzyme M protein